MAQGLKNLRANAGDTGDVGSIPGWGRCPGGGHGNPLQYSCLEDPHGWGSLVGYSPRGHKESDTTEHTRPLFSPNETRYSSFDFQHGQKMAFEIKVVPVIFQSF